MNSPAFWDEFFAKARERKEAFFGEWHSAGSRDGAEKPVFELLSVPGLEGNSLADVLRFAAGSFAMRRDLDWDGSKPHWPTEVRKYRELDALGRPLFATIAAELLVERGSFTGYSLADLSEHVIREFLSDWRAKHVDEKHLNLLLLATISGDLDLRSDGYQEVRDSLPGVLPAEYEDNQLRHLAAISVDWEPAEPILPKLLPDPIGEAFAIGLLDGDRLGGAGGNKGSWRRQGQSVLSAACRLSEGGVAEFTRRVITDYPASIGCLESTTGLNASDTSLSDLSALAAFKSLRRAAFEFTDVSDLRPLSGIRSLEGLVLSGTRVSDLSPLAGLTALRVLRLVEAKVEDLSPLAGLACLEVLDLYGTKVSDLSPLSELGSLWNLKLFRTEVSDLAPLAGLKSLQRLFLGHTPVSELSPLAGLQPLELLGLEGTRVSDLAPIGGLANLQDLSLQETLVSDLSALASLTCLKHLLLRKSAVEELWPLAGMPNLQRLELEATPVRDLCPLASVVTLSRLNLRGTSVTDLSALAGLTGLTSLELRQTKVSDLSPLANLHSLTHLDLQDTLVSDLAPLSGLNLLKPLDITGTPVTDLSPVSGISGLHVSGPQRPTRPKGTGSGRPGPRRV